MPRDSYGNYTLPAVTAAASGNIIDSSDYIDTIADIESGLNDVNPSTIAALNANIADGLFAYSTTTTDADPGAGIFRLNHATIASATEIYIDNTNAGATDISALIDTFDDSTSTVKGTLKLTQIYNNSIFAVFQVSGSVTDGTGYRKLTLTHVASGGTFVDEALFSVQFNRTGDKGDTGSTGAKGDQGDTGLTGGNAGYSYLFSDSTTMADPGAGVLRFNNATYGSITAIAIDDTSNASGNPDISADIISWADSTSATKGRLLIWNAANPEEILICDVTGLTDNSGWTELAVTYVTHAGALVNADELAVSFIRTGDKGETGDNANALTHNIIINGDFSLWQRGTSFAAIATSNYTADRFAYQKVGAAVHTVSRSTDVPTVAESGHLSSYSLLVDCTTIDASIAATDYSGINYKIEGYDFQAIAQQSFTLSFWVKGTKTGVHCVAFRNSGSDRSYIAEYTINVTDTWEKKTVNVLASPSAGTWDYTTGIGLDVWFMLAAGSTFQTTKDAWQTGNYLATSSQVNATDSVSNDFRIAQVQIEAGDAATDFNQGGSIQDITANCYRYYRPLVGSVSAYAVAGTTDIACTVNWDMRATPTITTNADGTPTNVSSAVFLARNKNGGELYISPSAVGYAAIKARTGTADAEL